MAGLIGRWIVLGLAARATELPAMKTLRGRGGTVRTDRHRRRRSLVILFGVVAAFMQGRSVLGPLTGGTVDWLFVSLLLFLSILPLVPLVFLPRGKVFEAALARPKRAGGSPRSSRRRGAIRSSGPRTSTSSAR